MKYLGALKRLVRSLRPRQASKPLSHYGLHGSDAEIVERVTKAKLTYLAPARLASIVHAIKKIEADGIAGDYIEAGCALGGSAIVISKIKSSDREFRVYDVFGMIPQPSERDGSDVRQRYNAILGRHSKGIDGDKYYGYEDDLYGKVQGSFREFGVDIETQKVKLIKGLVEDTMVIERPVAFAHVDVDWYDPVTTCLHRIEPRLVAGGSIILDDYSDWSGCRHATDAYFAARRGQFVFDLSAGSLKITRRAGAQGDGRV